jgi:NIMA (never in mitosis gene a)-related kinase
MTDFEILNKLGKGSFGVVYKVRRKADKTIYVMKQINISQLNSVFKAAALNEVKILSSLENPYIVKYYDSFLEKNFLNIIMEFCEGGDLTNHIKGQMGRPLTEIKIWKFFIQMCLGLRYIHGKKILHRDIKSMNIFLCKEDEIRIGDLGVAKAMAETANFAHTMVGTPYYLSPEMCEEKPYNEKSDIWALGCVLYEMCTQKHPFEATNQAALLLKILRGKFNPISSGYSAEMTEIVEACLCKDYRKRPSADALLNRPALIAKARALNINIGSESKAINEVVKVQNQPSQEVKPDLTKDLIPAKDLKPAKDRSNLKKEPSIQVNNNAVIKNIKNEVPRPSVRDVAAKPAIERDIKTAAQPNRVAPTKAENNLAKVYEYNQNLVKNAAGLKKEPSVNGIPNAAPVKDLAQKQVVPNSRPKPSQDNLLRVRESEKPQRLSTPQISSKGAAVEPQQKLVGKIKADAPVIQRPRLLEDKEKAPVFVYHSKNKSENRLTEDEKNEVRNLPDVVVPTPSKDKSKMDNSNAKKGNFFGKKEEPKKRPDLPSFLPQKVILESKKQPITYSKPVVTPTVVIIKPAPTQEVVDDKFIEEEFGSPEVERKTASSKFDESTSPNKDVFDIPVTHVDADEERFEVEGYSENDVNSDEDLNMRDDDEEIDESEDEAYDEDDDEEENNGKYFEEEKVSYDQRKNQEEDEDNSDEDDDDDDEEETQASSTNRIKRVESKKFVTEENRETKLQDAIKKKENLLQLIKERSNFFVSKWGQKAFDELSGFFRNKIGDESSEKTEAEIEEFLMEKLKGDVQPEQVFYVVSKILPLESHLEKVNKIIRKCSEDV